MKLFTVGPVACYPEVLEALGRQMMSHRSEEYLELHYDTVERLRGCLETENDIYLLSATGTGFMEASILNCVSDSVLVCINGSFGKRYANVARAHGRNVTLLEPPLGEPITVEALEAALRDHPEVEAVALTHNETSAGLINPLKELASIVKDQGKLLLVDAVSSMGGTTIKVDDWGIDICFSSSQKCFGVPPGLGIGSVSPDALKKSEVVPQKGWYFAWYFDLYKTRNAKIRKGIERLGLTTFPKNGFESPTVSCINAPEGVEGAKVYNAMRSNGFELAQGYGALKETTFRLGNMGYMPDENIDSMLETLGSILEGF
jgi:aspartate aminotransferase-like enzyme